MTSKHENLLPALGLLRVGLLLLALLDIALPLIEIMFTLSPDGNEHSFWSLLATVIAPVMAPLLMTVLLFDYIMSRVRAADAEGAMRARYVKIGRIELGMIGISLLFWIPFFLTRFG